MRSTLDLTDVRQAAIGHWVSIHRTVCGLSEQQLNPKADGPCPKCGGTDRFRAMNDVAASGALFYVNGGKKLDRTKIDGNWYWSVVPVGREISCEVFREPGVQTEIDPHIQQMRADIQNIV